MISLNNFYYVLYTLLFKPCKIHQGLFYPFGSTSPENFSNDPYDRLFEDISVHRGNYVIMFNEEPFFSKYVFPCFHNEGYIGSFKLLANSEHSEHKKLYCKEYSFLDFYFFFHGFLSLYWYNDIKYFHNKTSFKDDFLCLMNIVDKDRSYRLYLASKLKEKNLIGKGTISLNLDKPNLIKNELFSTNSKLSTYAKKHVLQNLTLEQKTIHADTKNFRGELSAELDFQIYEMWQNSFFHIVPETVFYYDKLHLTEKIFKPIVSRRPFILLASPGNLKYIKGYGFKTFDRWIDESYDNEPDNDKRINLAVQQLEYINRLSKFEKNKMFGEMQETLDYNFNHFFNEFKKIIVEELVNNFEGCINQWNNGRFDDKLIDKSIINFDEVKRILSQ